MPVFLLVWIPIACSPVSERESVPSSPPPVEVPAPAADLSGQIQEGIELYRNGDFVAAAERFESAAAARPRDERVQFYLGSSLLLLHRHRAALADDGLGARARREDLLSHLVANGGACAAGPPPPRPPRSRAP